MRAYAGRPTQVRQTRTLQVYATVDRDALEAAVARLGWRVYCHQRPRRHPLGDPSRAGLSSGVHR